MGVLRPFQNKLLSISWKPLTCKMVFSSLIDGNDIIASLHTLSIVLLVAVIGITAARTFPRLMATRRSRSSGAIEKRIDRSFAKTESKIKEN
ncbi:hypothetical protein J0A71_05g12080 [Encephalitozoon cuniculi]|nr:hypothetical protein J0A71_01g02370 [Encephalitozoon cuniculi]UYI26464.1 hypothetical protein J0A71_02g02890 [Encephalitozoon cuniculi]UYI27345.1 hypothetical protein J0A71_05g12080 [Encephalitozoon cuniculi]